MSGRRPAWIRNEMNDGDKPICPYCEEPYEDGAIFDVKNYPADGRATMFFKCGSCNKEAQHTFDWDQIERPEGMDELSAKVKELEEEVDSRGRKIQDLVDIIVDWPETGLKAKRDERMQERLEEAGKDKLENGEVNDENWKTN